MSGAVLARINDERTSTIVTRFLRIYGPIVVREDCCVVERLDGLIEIVGTRKDAASYVVGIRRYSGDDFVEKTEAVHREMLRDKRCEVPRRIWKSHEDSGIVTFPFKMLRPGGVSQ